MTSSGSVTAVPEQIANHPKATLRWLVGSVFVAWLIIEGHSRHCLCLSLESIGVDVRVGAGGRYQFYGRGVVHLYLG